MRGLWRFLIVGVLLFLTQGVAAQSERSGEVISDSIAMPTIQSNYQPREYTLRDGVKFQLYDEINFTPTLEPFDKKIFEGGYIKELPEVVVPSVLAPSYSFGGNAYESRQMDIFTSSTGREIIGLGTLRTLGTGVTYRFDDHLSATVEATYSDYRGAAYGTDLRSVSFSGELRYAFSDRFAVRTFGSYSTSKGVYSSSSLFNSSPMVNFGATVDFGIGERFGVEVGGQAFYDPSSGAMQALPVVIPYFKMGDVKLGVDVGGIIYDAIYKGITGNSSGSVFTTGAPPPMFKR